VILTDSVGGGLQIGVLPQRRLTVPSSRVSMQLKVQSFSAKPVHHPSANFSSGLSPTIGVGQRTVAKDAINLDDSCVLCSQESETIDHHLSKKAIDHLMTTCVYSREIWYRVFLRLGWSNHVPSPDCISFADWWNSAHKWIAKSDRKCFDSVIILTCWLLWKERNRRTFEHRLHNAVDLTSFIADEVVCWTQAGYQHLLPVATAFGRMTGRDLVVM